MDTAKRVASLDFAESQPKKKNVLFGRAAESCGRPRSKNPDSKIEETSECLAM
jgi:hypothetical protein